MHAPFADGNAPGALKAARRDFRNRPSAGSLEGRLPVKHLESGNEEQVNYFECLIGLIGGRASALWRAGDEIGMKHVQAPSVSHVNSIGPKRPGVLDGMELSDGQFKASP